MMAEGGRWEIDPRTGERRLVERTEPQPAPYERPKPKPKPRPSRRKE